jgi:hypothetical protein
VPDTGEKTMTTLTTDDFTKELRLQYQRLKDAVDGFYAGSDVQALNVSIALRVLIVDSVKNKSLLSRLRPDYWELDIRDKPLSPKTIFALPAPIQIAGSGTKQFIRPDLQSPPYQSTTLQKWWHDHYQAIHGHRLSKRQIVLTLCDKAGGAHIDATIPDSHLLLAQPPFAFQMDNGGEIITMQPNLVYGVTGQSGYEMQDYLERHLGMAECETL